MNYCRDPVGVLHGIYNIQESVGIALRTCIREELRVGDEHHLVVAERAVDNADTLSLSRELIYYNYVGIWEKLL